MMGMLGMDLPEREQPLVLPWASQGRPAGLIQFDRAEQWVAFVDGLGIDPRIPSVVGVKFGRAQKLYLLGWIDADLIKAGELVALTALELALKDRYGDHRPKNDRSFAALLKHMVEADGLGDERIPMVVRSGGSANVIVAFIRNVQLNRAIYAVEDKPAINFWIILHSNCLDTATIEWCKLFGKSSGTVHWKRFVPATEQAEFEKGLLAAINKSADEWGAYAQ